MTYALNEHHQALLDRLATDAMLAGRIVDTAIDPENPPMEPPYVVLIGSMPAGDSDRLSLSTPTRLEYVFTLAAVGEDRQQAVHWADAAWALLLGWTPTVAGWSPDPIKHEGRDWALERDTSFTPAVVFTTTELTLTTNRSTNA